MVLPGSSRQYHRLPPHLPSTPFPSWKPIHTVRVVLFATIMWSTLMLPRPMQTGSTVATVTPLMHNTSMHTSTYTMEHVPSAPGIPQHSPTMYTTSRPATHVCSTFTRKWMHLNHKARSHTHSTHTLLVEKISSARAVALPTASALGGIPSRYWRSHHPWIRRKRPHKQVPRSYRSSLRR